MARERLWNGHKQGLRTVKKEVWGVRSKAQTERRTQWGRYERGAGTSRPRHRSLAFHGRQTAATLESITGN